jgi:enoyl-CoA hydratase/carnithine racemase
MIIASEKASFIQSFSKVGIASDCGGHWLLRRAVGPYIAKELMLTCRPVSAQEGLALGFVNRVVPPDTLEAETMELARSLAQGAPLAMAAIKKLIDAGDNMTFEELLEEEKKQQVKLLLSADCREGIEAFLNKRKPVFSGG